MRRGIKKPDTKVNLHRTMQMLRALSARSEEIRENERARIAREVHDELGQTLTVLKMDLAWLRKNWGAPSSKIEKRVQGMDETLDSLVQKVRQISSELRPPLLDLGLVPAIEWQLEQFQRRAGIRTRVRIEPAEVDVSRKVATAVFRVIQEALTNIARHACANQVDFSMHLRHGELHLVVTDNGRGITSEAMESLSSFGLTGMRERIHHIGGILEIEQMTTGGTCVSVRLPIERLSEQSEERKYL
jgi:signal transduction histidine kinase